VLAQVGGDHLDLAAGFAGDLVGQRLQAVDPARYQNEVMATLGQAVGVDRADAGRSRKRR
jgi:hypothetical protein